MSEKTFRNRQTVRSLIVVAVFGLVLTAAGLVAAILMGPVYYVVPSAIFVLFAFFGTAVFLGGRRNIFTTVSFAEEGILLNDRGQIEVICWDAVVCVLFGGMGGRPGVCFSTLKRSEESPFEPFDGTVSKIRVSLALDDELLSLMPELLGRIAGVPEAIDEYGEEALERLGISSAE